MIALQRFWIRVIAISVLLGYLGLCSQKVRADYTAKVDPTTQFQTIEGWGTSLCWFAHVLGGAPDAIRNHYADLIFDPNKGLGLNIARYNIGGGENPKYHSMEFRAQIPGYEPTSGVYDWTQDANQRWFLQAAMLRGANQLEAFSNSPPYWMTNSGSVTGSTDGTSDNLNPAYYTAFADYLTTVVQHFHDTWHITFRDIEPLNEPIAGWWTFGGRQEGCHFDRSTQNTIIKDLGASVASKKLLSAVTGSDESFIDDAVLSLMSLDSTALATLSKVNTHTYGGSHRVGLWAVASSAGKANWMSEHGDGDGTGLTMSESLLADMKQMHPTGWVYWQAVDGAGSGWGMLSSELNNPTDYSYTVNEKYYVMANYSRFIRPGYKIIFTDDEQSLVAYNQATRTLVIVTTNSNGSDTNVTYDLSNFRTVAGPVSVYRTSSTENLAHLTNLSVSRTKQFSNVAKANSVTTYVIQGAVYTPTITATVNDSTIGTGANQFHYTGSWTAHTQTGAYQGDYHASVTPNNTYTLPFNGTQALLYASTGPDHGIAAVSVDGGAEVEVDLYTPTAVNNTFLYATPTLPSGLHMLKVRVTGRKNPAATQVLIPADRVDIVAGQGPITATNAYLVINRNSGDVMDVSGAATTAGAPVIQWPMNGGNNQLWQLVPGTLGFNLVNVNSGLYLDLAGGSKAPAAAAVQAAKSGKGSQAWVIRPLYGPFSEIVNRNSGLFLNVNGDSTTDGASIIQWADNGGYNLDWILLRMR